MSKKIKVSFLSSIELEKLNTKRLLTLKKSAIAKKSALWERNKLKEDQHPFDLILGDVETDRDDFRILDYYIKNIKKILIKRENVK